MFALLLGCCIGCEDKGIKFPPDTSKQVTITQGVWGNVWFWKGNFQPWNPTGTVIAVERQVLIYKPTPFDSVTMADMVFYRTIRTKLIAATASNRTGFFQQELPPGNYSVFVKEDSLFWMGVGNSIGIGGFTVWPDSVTKIQININYAAGY